MNPRILPVLASALSAPAASTPGCPTLCSFIAKDAISSGLRLFFLKIVSSLHGDRNGCTRHLLQDPHPREHPWIRSAAYAPEALAGLHQLRLPKLLEVVYFLTSPPVLVEHRPKRLPAASVETTAQRSSALIMPFPGKIPPPRSAFLCRLPPVLFNLCSISI